MVYKYTFILCIVLFFLFSNDVLAHSLNNRRLLRIEALNKVNVDIAPRPDTFFQKRDISANKHYKPRVQSIEHDDILRFTLNAYNQTHHIHLVPNHDLFHPNAVVNTEGVDKPLNHKEYRVYRGYVVDSTLSEKRWQEDQVGLWRDHETLNNHGDGGILGWARFIIRHDIKHDLEYPIFEGAFMTNDDTYHVKSSETYQRVKRSDDAELHHAYRSPSSNVHMVIYRDSDTVVVPVMKRDGTIAYGDSCAVDKLLYNNNQKSYSFDPALSLISSSPIKEKEKELDTHLSKLNYDAFNGIHNMAMMGSLSKRAPTGCPTTKKINYMGAAADCTYTKYYQSDTQARMQIINDWNTASAVYEKQMNIGLGLINITVMSSTCPTTPDPNNIWNQGCSNAYDITTRLSDFSRWRAKTPNDGAGLWHLMTNCPTGAELGVAWVGALCTTDVQEQRGNGQTQYVSGTGVSSVVRDEWKVVAHEIGHGFGAKHDCTADTCRCNGGPCDCCPLSSTQCDAGGTFIMNPVNNASAGEFSPCTLDTICQQFPSKGQCLKNPGTIPTTGLQMCGNGIKEAGEDCDSNGQDTPCCDAKTCKFQPGAKCDDYNDLCCNNCQIRPAGYVCRPATGNCDTQEVCSGNTGDCPNDSFKSDGEQCGEGLQCASGQCTSRDLQCRNRLTSMNLTKACGGMTGAGSCQVSCASPNSPLQCIIFTGNYIDGTPCGVGGACKQGQCSLDNFGSNLNNWINNNKHIFIPVVVVVGLLLICCISRCIYTGTHGYRNLNNDTYVVTTVPGNGYAPPHGQYYTPPPGHQPQGWVDPSSYNGPYTPSAPPPSYTPNTNYRQDTYEMNPSNQWRSNSTVPSSPSPANNNINSNSYGHHHN